MDVLLHVGMAGLIMFAILTPRFTRPFWLFGLAVNAVLWPVRELLQHPWDFTRLYSGEAIMPVLAVLFAWLIWEGTRK